MSTSSNMVLIETKTVGAGGSSTIDFTGIPTTGYTDLQIVFSTRSSYDNIYVPWTGFYVTANGSTSGYSGRMLEGNGSSAYSQTNNVSTAWEYAASNDSATTSNTFSSGTIYIPNYAGSTYKSLSMDKVTENNATGASQTIYAGLWSNTAAINRITFTEPNGTFVEGSTASLYGIKSASKVAKATGGNISLVNGYWVHTFTASGTFTPTENLSNIECLVVAGGGGGAGDSGGGGGAGGYRTATGISCTASIPYAVTVGGGGAGGSTGSSGSNSTFSSITSAGGGYGATWAYPNGSAGGAGGSGGGGSPAVSGGAGAGGTGNTPSTSPSQGNNGGAGINYSSGYTAGGGGGAGAVGGDATTSGAGSGGIGTQSSISGAATYYAGGGGGGGDSARGKPGGGGGNGGGGAGGYGGVGTSGTSNTGGGGGGGNVGSGGSGGSGIVIVRYAA